MSILDKQVSAFPKGRVWEKGILKGCLGATSAHQTHAKLLTGLKSNSDFSLKVDFPLTRLKIGLHAIICHPDLTA